MAQARTDPHDSTGKPKDAGWEVGVRKIVPAALPDVWQFLIGDGLALWLGDTVLPTAKGAAYLTDDGVRGEVIRRTENSRIRVSWQPADWPHSTTLQLSVKEAESGTTIAIQHDELADREERRMMLGHWKNVAEQLAVAIDRL